MKRIAIFASGTGSNAKKILEYFKTSSQVSVDLICTNKSDAGVLEIAKNFEVPSLLFEKEQFFMGDGYTPILKELKIDWIILAGFLWKIPLSLLRGWENKIINIHPALLPKYGGKGMYGNAVHSAVIQAKESVSGITIHYVDEQYDHGAVIFQAECAVVENDTPASLAQRIHALEHLHFPRVIEEVIRA